MPPDIKTMRVEIFGRVQGVWFRGWTVREAEALGLDGWVRNRAEGHVEALFSGPAATVDAMIGYCRRGPPGAQVTDIHAEPWDQIPDPGFHQKPSR